MSYNLSMDEYYKIVNGLKARARKFKVYLNITYEKMNELYLKPRCELTGVMFGSFGDSRIYDRLDLSLPYTDNNMIVITHSTYDKRLNNMNDIQRVDAPLASVKRESIKRSAKSRNIPFSLTTNRVQELLNLNRCYFTGVELNHSPNHPNQLSFDRIDNNLGYTDENVVVCAKSFNSKKGDLTVQDIIALYNGVVGHGIIKKDLTFDVATSILPTTNNDNFDKDIEMEDSTEPTATEEFVVPTDRVVSLTKTTGVNISDGLKQMNMLMGTIDNAMIKIYDGMKYINELKGRLAELEGDGTALSIYTSEDNALSLYVQAVTETRIKEILIDDVNDQIAGVEQEIIDMFNEVKNLKPITILKN